MKSKTKDRLFYIVVISLVIAVAIGCFAYIIKDRNNFNKNRMQLYRIKRFLNNVILCGGKCRSDIDQ